jgi:hypothetical protein
MKTYTLHVPPGAQPGDPEPLERAELIPDGFSWGAFLFTFLWFLAQRLWLAGLGVLILALAVPAGLYAAGVSPGAALLVQVLLAILIGLEANSLKRWTYARRGRPIADIVLASNREEAETKAFARWLQRRPAWKPTSPVGVSPAVTPPRASEPVIGLFPEAERSR